MAESLAPADQPPVDARQESENEYRRLVEMSPDLVLLCDEAGQILYANLAGVEMLGYDNPRDLLGQHLADITHPDSQARVRARLDELMTEMRELPFVEERFRRKDGTAFYAEMMAFPFVYRGAHVAHLVFRDSTKRRQAEALHLRLKRRVLAVSVPAAVFFFGASAYFTYQYTESVQFCGTLCHSVMSPRYIQHRNSTHAHVSCAECHIGAGAAWYVKAKFSGLHQVHATLTRRYPSPIPTPIENLRPAAETCAGCHSPEVFHGDRTSVSRRVPDDGQAADPEVTAVALHVGGKLSRSGSYAGIHWHADPETMVEYRAVDRQRLRIAEVRVARKDGTRTLYSTPAIPTPPDTVPWRVMDCSDCHNRVAHRRQSPERAVDDLILAGGICWPLPDVKQASLAAIRAKYDTLGAAGPGILANLRQYYGVKHPDLPQTDRDALRPLADLLYREAYEANVNPDLKIDWDTYPDHVGHNDGVGCFRCHDGEHVTTSGRAIPMDCDSCHTILVERVRESKIDPRLGRAISVKESAPPPASP